MGRNGPGLHDGDTRTVLDKTKWRHDDAGVPRGFPGRQHQGAKMTKNAALPVALFATELALTALAAPAHATSTRTFVSATGTDSNPCSFGAPCRSMQAAHNATTSGGEIDVLDPVGYGAITITKPISIVGHGFAAMSTVSGGTIVTISATRADSVNLRW
jgi:hypothetical protein